MESALLEELSSAPDSKPPPPLDSIVSADSEEVRGQIFGTQLSTHLSILTDLAGPKQPTPATV
jgi:hypothetical protein